GQPEQALGHLGELGVLGRLPAPGGVGVPAADLFVVDGIVAGVALLGGHVLTLGGPPRPHRTPGTARDAAHDAAGRSHSTPSGGTRRTADAGWPAYGTSSAVTVPMLPTPEPP